MVVPTAALVVTARVFEVSEFFELIEFAGEGGFVLSTVILPEVLLEFTEFGISIGVLFEFLVVLLV